MSNFSFGALANTSFTSNTTNYLKPYDIYKVVLSKIEKTSIQGKKDPTANYDLVSLEFTGVGENKGVFSTNLFVPNKDSDFERTANPNTGKTSPSSFERFQFTLMQIVEAINPEGAQKIKDNAGKLKTIDDFIGLVIKALNGKKTEVYLKLVGRNNEGKTYSALPTSCWINQDGNPQPLNFINAKEDALNFSNYELTQMKAYQNAKPTNMDKVENNPDKADNDIDIDDIEL